MRSRVYSQDAEPFQRASAYVISAPTVQGSNAHRMPPRLFLAVIALFCYQWHVRDQLLEYYAVVNRRAGYFKMKA